VEDQEVEATSEELRCMGMPDDDDEAKDVPFEDSIDYRQVSRLDQEPPIVSPVPRLIHDVRALMKIFEADTPAQLLLRPANGAYSVVYGGGNASGEGFGLIISPLGMKSLFKMGFWCLEASENSSNWRKFKNLLE
jgi:hypothetical protein